MKQTLRALSLVLAMQPALAAAQQFPTVPDHTVIGRVGIGGSSGASQAIPFSVLSQSILTGLCQTNNAFPVYSTSSAAWVCSPAPSANTVHAGPATGPAAQPTFRALVGADLPTPGASSLGGVQSKTCLSSNWFNSLSTGGIFGCTQPSFADLTSQATLAQLPTIGANTALCSIAGGTPIACTKTQVTTLINVATATLSGALPAFPNTATTFFRGDGSYQTLNCAALSDSSVGCNAARGQLPGETSTGSATAGNVGEYIESVIASGSAVSLSTGVGKTVTSISLTAGDWDVAGNVNYNTAAATSVTAILASISGTTNTTDLTPGKLSSFFFPATVPTASTPAWAVPVGPYRLSLASTTTVFLVAFGSFTASTLTAHGLIRARRVR